MPIRYPNAIYDETEQRWISDAEVAEVGFTAFTRRPKAEQVTGRLVVRRIPDLNPTASQDQARVQESLFDTWRFTPSSPPPAPRWLIETFIPVTNGSQPWRPREGGRRPSAPRFPLRSGGDHDFDAGVLEGVAERLGGLLVGDEYVDEVEWA